MKNLIVILLMGSLTGTSSAQDPGWPREKTDLSGNLIYYQPQLDDWRDFRQREARMAISLKPVGGQPTVGVITPRTGCC